MLIYQHDCSGSIPTFAVMTSKLFCVHDNSDKSATGSERPSSGLIFGKSTQRFGRLCVLWTCLFASPLAQASTWGIGASWREGTIPFKDSPRDEVKTLIPAVYYEGEHVFLRDLHWGIKAYEGEQDNFNLIVRRRFVNIPRRMQNEYQEDALDVGGQWLHSFNDNQRLRVEALTETKARRNFYVGSDWFYSAGNLQIRPHAGLRYKNSNYNTYYYGLGFYPDAEKERIGSGVDAEIGISLHYPIWGGLEVMGGIDYTYFDSRTRGSRYIDDNGTGTFRIGVSYFGEKQSASGTSLPEGSYLRVAHGWATPSDMGDILTLGGERDNYNSQMTSLFYGHPLVTDWFGLPMDVYLHSGVVYHYSNTYKGERVQEQAVEGIVSAKLYYNLTWPWKWRIGVAEGLSYISRPTSIEEREMERKDNHNSKLMNYLDISFDVNVGSALKKPELNPLWVGYSMHHRSAIFKYASQFGRVKGGSNYNTFYAQWTF